MKNDNMIIKPEEKQRVSQENPLSTVVKIKMDRLKLSAPKNGYINCATFSIFTQNPSLSPSMTPISLDRSPDDRALPHPIMCQPAQWMARCRHGERKVGGARCFVKICGYVGWARSNCTA